MRESGSDAGMRNLGRFFIALIPWAVAIGAIAWLGFWISIQSYRHEIAAEKRRAEFTASPVPQKSKLKIETVSHRSCGRISSVDIDGESLTVYVERTCKKTEIGLTGYMALKWELLSPNRTVIQTNWTNKWDLPENIGEKVECVWSITTDERADTLLIILDGA